MMLILVVSITFVIGILILWKGTYTMSTGEYMWGISFLFFAAAWLTLSFGTMSFSLEKLVQYNIRAMKEIHTNTMKKIDTRTCKPSGFALDGIYSSDYINKVYHEVPGEY